jgi:hypothetical protein
MASIQTIELKEEMFDNVRAGIKTATLRTGKRDYELGTAILFGDKRKNAVFINVTKISYMKMGSVSDDDALQEGYQCREDLISVMKAIYDITGNDPFVTQVKFEYISG